MYRLDWKTFKKVYKTEYNVYSTLHKPSLLFQVYKTKEEMLRNLGRTMDDIEDLVSDLSFYKGLPIMAVDKKTANIIRGRKAKGRMWDVKLISDEHGAVTIIGDPIQITTQEVQIEKENWLKQREEYYEPNRKPENKKHKSSKSGENAG